MCHVNRLTPSECLLKERTGRFTAIYSGNYHAQPFVLCFHFETPRILRNFFDKEWILNSFSIYKEWISNILSILSILSIKALISGSRYSCACDPFSAIKNSRGVISQSHFAFALITHAGSKQQRWRKAQAGVGAYLKYANWPLTPSHPHNNDPQQVWSGFSLFLISVLPSLGNQLLMREGLVATHNVKEHCCCQKSKRLIYAFTPMKSWYVHCAGSDILLYNAQTKISLE